MPILRGAVGIRKIDPCMRCGYRIKNHKPWNCKRQKHKKGHKIGYLISLTPKMVG